MSDTLSLAIVLIPALVIAIVFHYHYQWNKHNERERNEVAIREHLVYIDALFGRNASIVELACRAHLASAKETLIRSSVGPEAPAARTRRRSGRAMSPGRPDGTLIRTA